MQVQSVACIQNQQLLHQGSQQELANVVKWLDHTWEPYPESFWLTLFFVFFWRNWFIFQSMLNMSGREWLWVSELSRKLVMVSLPFFTSWNLKAVNLYLHSFFLRSEFDCSLVADSMLFIRILINFKSLNDCLFGIIQVIRNNKCIYCRWRKSGVGQFCWWRVV